ncbi:MAG: pyruvate dehydrogenase (acetyl-transferring) E1 component subunit alpha [Pseudomonadota bacterium]
MPRTTIRPNTQVEHLVILGEDGEVDEDRLPDLDDTALLDLHRAMLRARRFDERLLNLQRQGKLGTFAPVKGQEASQVGSVAALRASDWLVPSYRETAMHLWRGAPMAGLFLFTAGYNEGGRIAPERNDLPQAVPVGTQPLHAMGIGYGMRYRGDDAVVMTCFGDGATAEGDVHEALNFASVFRAPVIFLCQNNQWAISVPRERQSHAATLAQRAIAYDMPGLQVDGNDVLAVHAATREAVERARAGDGPTFIECVTYRLEVHTTADDPTRYRDEAEVERWKKRDPIERFRGFLERRGLLDDEAVEAMEDELRGEIEAAWQEAQAQMETLTDPLVMFDHVYADRPPHLAAQRDTLRQWLRTADQERG